MKGMCQDKAGTSVSQGIGREFGSQYVFSSCESFELTCFVLLLESYPIMLANWSKSDQNEAGRSARHSYGK